MNITRQSTGALTEKIILQLAKEDYAANVEKTLKDYRRKANIPGFRPGKVPMQLIERMYGKAILLDELDKLINKHLDEYIKAEQLRLLGEPIVAADSPELDIDKSEVFEFVFEVGLQPQISIEWPKKEKLLQYEIIVTDETVNDEIEIYRRRFATRLEVDKVEENSRLVAEIVECDENGQPKEKGLNKKDFYIDLSVAKDGEEKSKLIGAEKGATLHVNLKNIIASEDDLLYSLAAEGKNIGDISDDFELKITSVIRLENPPINQELFDKIFGEGKVTSEEMFRDKMREEVSFMYDRDVTAINLREAKKYLLATQKVDLPSEFLKRWLKSTQKEKNEEELEKQFPAVEEEFKWQLLKNQILTENKIEVTEDEILDFAGSLMRWQMKYYYGIIGMPAEELREYGKALLKKEEDVRRMVSDILDRKVLEVVKNNVKVDLKKLTPEEFYEQIKE